MCAFGSIVLTRFPFAAPSGNKRRPALVVSRDNNRRLDVIVCFIPSLPRTGPDMAAPAARPGTGPKLPSVVRLDTIATPDRAIIMGKPGGARPDRIAAQRARFFGVFDVAIPWPSAIVPVPPHRRGRRRP